MKFGSMKQVETYLRAKGVPKEGIKAIEGALIDDALRQTNNLTVARFYTATAIVLHDNLGFGPVRIPRTLHAVDEIFRQVADGEKDWEEVMDELKEKTGMCINTDPNWSETEIDKDAREV